MIKKLLILLISLAALKASGQQQFMLAGRIIDQQKHPIPFASIYIASSTYGTTTNETGY
jgi:hypothetical protein